MKGIVYNMLQTAVELERGPEGWEQVLEGARSDGIFTSLGTYADDEFTRLVAATATLVGHADPNDTVRWFAERSTPFLVARYPVFFEGHRSLWTFLPTLNDIIHPEVRKVFPGAIAPSFRFGRTPEGYLEMEYRSPRRLCAFAEGFIAGAATHFGETVSITQPRCARRGDEACVLVCQIEPPA